LGGQGDTTDTGGLFFPQAIQQVFVGLYIQQVKYFYSFFDDTSLISYRFAYVPSSSWRKLSMPVD
jgi:hypothetical protein